MKRVLSCLLIISLVLSVGSVSFAVDNYTGDMNFKYSVLQSLGILPETDRNENYGILRDLSKKAFLSYVCNIYGDYGFGEVDGDRAVAVAEDLGLIHKNQDDLHKLISYDEAMTIIVRLLSYEIHAQTYGGFPYGYNTVAASIGLTDGLSVGSGQNLKEHDVIQLLYNTINAPYAQISYITDDGVVYENNSDKTVLEELRGIYRIDGVIESTGTAWLRSDVTAGEGKILIDGYAYDAEEDYSDFLGMNVMAYIKKDSADFDNVMAVIPYSNDELVIYAEYLVGANEDFSAIKYYNEKDKLVSAKLADMATVMYNGQPLANYTAEAFAPKDGSIRLVKNSGSAGYDVAFITSFETIVADNVSKLNKSISNIYTYDADNISLSLEENNEDIIEIRDENGVVGIDDISAGDVVKLAKSYVGGRYVVKGTISRTKISGTVSAINKGDDLTLTIDGTKYVLSETYEEALAAGDDKALEIKTGKGYSFYLDCDGEIAYAEDTDGVVKYAIVYATSVEGVFESKCSVRMYTADGEWKNLALAEKLEYDGERGVSAENVIDRLKCSKDGNLSVIGYMTNSDGEISMIDTPIIYSDINTAYQNVGGEFDGIEEYSDNYRYNNSSFDSEIYIKNGATMWFINVDDLSDENSYTIGEKSIIQGDEVCTVSAYGLDEGMFAELFIVNRSGSTVSAEIQRGDLFVIDEVGQAANSDGEVLEIITGKMGVYERFSYYCEDGVTNGIGRGDVVSVHTLTTGKVDKITKYFTYGDTSADNLYSYPSNMHAVDACIKGTVIKNNISDGWIKVDCGGERPRVIRTNNVKGVIIYDSQTDKLYNGSLSDIESGVQLVTKTKFSNATTLVVYQ